MDYLNFEGNHMSDNTAIKDSRSREGLSKS
jgi:hypothetical protein